MENISCVVGFLGRNGFYLLVFKFFIFFKVRVFIDFIVLGLDFVIYGKEIEKSRIVWYLLGGFVFVVLLFLGRGVVLSSVEV